MQYVSTGGRTVKDGIQGMIEWEEPDRPGKWEKILAEVMKRPGEWAAIKKATYKSCENTAYHLRHRLVKYQPGKWEFTARKTEDGGKVYARYLGPDEP